MATPSTGALIIVKLVIFGFSASRFRLSAVGSQLSASALSVRPRGGTGLDRYSAILDVQITAESRARMIRSLTVHSGARFPQRRGKLCGKTLRFTPLLRINPNVLAVCTTAGRSASRVL